MSKRAKFAFGLTSLVVAVAIVSLVLNILVFVRILSDNSNTHHPTPATKTTPIPHLPENPTDCADSVPPFSSEPIVVGLETVFVNSSEYCPSYAESENSAEWQEAASHLRNTIDVNFDPCEDFYAFACNNFISDKQDGSFGSSTAEQAQAKVNTKIAEALEIVDVSDEKRWSATERITKAVLDSCVKASLRPEPDPTHVAKFLADIQKWFGGVPFLNYTLKEDLNIFEVIGQIEQNRALGTLMESWVTTDYIDINMNALYISQPSLPMPREYYVMPQFIEQLEKRIRAIENILIEFSFLILDNPEKYAEMIREAASEVARLEREIAVASLPDSEMRNYGQLYNPYDLEALRKAYPSIGWESYMNNLLSSVENATEAAFEQVIVSQLSYFGWLNTFYAGEGHMKSENIVNYMITQLLFEEAEFLGPTFRRIVEETGYVRYAQRRRRGARRIGQLRSRFVNGDVPVLGCIETAMVYMPYGPGYVYAKSLQNKEKIVEDAKNETELVIKSFQRMMNNLNWMTQDSLNNATEKVNEMVKNIGWPTELFGDFNDFSAIDAYHKKDYTPILDAYKKNSSDFYTILSILRKALLNREAFRLLPLVSDRSIFLESPAMVSAWYQPERNSLTIPCALWNPPYYNYGYPKAFNFAGHGGVIGHELVHAFDEEGNQFDEIGFLGCDSWSECGWMDNESKKGFRNMTQCVVSQYSRKCCIEKQGKIHCVNGAATRDENIADLGGLQAAYLAYQLYMSTKEEDEKRLPGLEQYTPHQIFWLAYAHTWCRKHDDDSLVHQLMINPHAPASCRTNQVVQDIPSFGVDFGCIKGQDMSPTSDARCEVWDSD